MLNTATFIIDGIEYDLREIFNCWVRRVQVSPPVKKTNEVNVPYRNGKLRLKLSETPVFEERRVVLLMTLVGPEPLEEFEQITALLNGQDVQCVINGSDWYYEGECVVDTLKSQEGRWQFSIVITAYPYQLKRRLTMMSETATATELVLRMYNEQMPVMPIFTTTSASSVTVTLNGTSYTFGSVGDHQSANIILKQGWNELTIKGQNVPVTVSYREGRL